ncbi:hypothetical protein MKX01_007140 [Papaver californicum]|nr:hypothetical protein MKX01_007140 [Papaver californicum]
MVEGEEKSSTANPELKETSSKGSMSESCSIRSCRPCVKSHKQRTSCTGKGPGDEIIPLSQFDNNLIISDYKFLEEAKKVADSAQKTREAVFGHSSEFLKMPYKITKLRLAALRRKTELVFLPNGMARRGKNKSFYHQRVDENTKLCSVIEKHLKLGPWNNKLRPFCEEILDRLEFFIRVNAKRPKFPYRELDIKSSISRQLANTLIVEFLETNSPSPKRIMFKEEEPEEEEGPQISNLMKCVNSEPMLNGETEEDTDDFFFSNFNDLELPENADINPDDFLDLDGEFLQGLNDEELEEGEIPA